MTLPTLILLVGGLMLIVGASLFFLNPSSSDPETEISAAPQAAGIPYPEVERIPLAQAKARFDSGAAIFLDIRTEGQYEQAHVPDALFVPLSELGTRAQELDRDAEILTYCTWPNEETSARAARILLDLGFQDVKAIQGGFAAWQAAGYDIVRGP